MKKRILSLVLSLILVLTALPSSGLAAGSSEAPGEGEKLGYAIEYVNATFLGETADVSRQVMEIDGGMVEPIHFAWDYTRYVNLTFGLCQISGEQVRELAQTADDHVSVNADEFETGWPVYLDIFAGDDGRLLSREPLGLRINKGLVASRTPDNLQAEFQSGLKLDMSHLLPGMELDVLPFLIPVTVKTYSDGAIRIGIGVNSTDVDFWMKAGSGEMPEAQLASDLEELFYGDPHNLDYKARGKSMGVIVLFSGWAEGNVNTTDPIKGHMEIFIGTGFDVTSQYGIFTFELTLTGGGQGLFDFSFNFDEENSKYNFSADEIRLGLKGGLEVYGGIGCCLASIGVYGAASLAYQERLYPDAEIEHLILAGEVGLKAKLFGKVIACFKIVSGSHDFVFDKKKATLLSLAADEEEMRQFLLDSRYADQPGVLLEPGGSFTWHGEFVERSSASNRQEEDPDFSHLLATDINPDSHVQIVSSGSRAFPEMSLVFLGYDQSRARGNRSSLMASYYNISHEWISEPKFIADDGTADYNPVLYAGSDGPAYLVWENANAAVPGDASLARIADMTDLYISECVTSANWHSQEKITDFAGTGVYATGAAIAVTDKGEPVVAYYTNSTDDPAGLSGGHDLYLATRGADRKWTSEKWVTINGAMDRISVARFGEGFAVAASWEEEGEKKTALFRSGKMIWEKKGASSAAFLGMGYSDMRLTWYEDGSVKMMSSALNEEALTPESINVPNGDYEIFGHLGSSTVMILSSSMLDKRATAFAFISRDGGRTWGRSDLSKMDEYAYVSHISAAYTEENEPVIVYSVQNYTVNVDLEETLAVLDGDLSAVPESDPSDKPVQFLVGQDDERFTDTRADLYICARGANRHVTFDGSKALDVGDNKPGGDAKIRLTVRNTGLYEVSDARILCDGKEVGRLSKTLKPWDTEDVEVSVKIPMNPGATIQEYTFDLVLRDDGTPDSTVTVPVPEGYLSAKIWHSFQFGDESVKFTVTNHGYTDKTARLVVRDEARGVTLEERTIHIDGGWHLDSAFKAKDRVFARDGIENVTLFILLNGEDTDSPEISTNRVKSVVPLPEIYGQEVPDGVEKNHPDGTESSSVPESSAPAPSGDGSGRSLPPAAAAAIVVCVLAAAALCAFLLRKRQGGGRGPDGPQDPHEMSGGPAPAQPEEPAPGAAPSAEEMPEAAESCGE
ncbi:MAG: hypothetical protein IJL66_04760 [Lachnospiraceae bacterium]|nr:hypothetical protein [Lachnospiraceae bacterium]